MVTLRLKRLNPYWVQDQTYEIQACLVEKSRSLDPDGNVGTRQMITSADEAEQNSAYRLAWTIKNLTQKVRDFLFSLFTHSYELDNTQKEKEAKYILGLRAAQN